MFYAVLVIAGRECRPRERRTMQHIKITPAAARVNAGLTQRQVAERLHVTQATIVAWEKGASEPSVTQARKLGELYDMPLDNIIFLDEITN